jgi:protein FrlC
MIDNDRLAAVNQHYKQFSLDYFLDAQERMGVSNIELWMSLEHFPLDSVRYWDCKSLLRKLSGRGFRVVCATFPSCDFQYQYACQDKAYRRKCVDYFINGLEAAEALGAKIITANAGWGYWNETKAQGLEAAKEIIGKVLTVAERKKIIIAMETLTQEESLLVNTMRALKDFLDDFRSPFLKPMLDTVAMRSAGETIDEWFHLFKGDIGHMHFVDGLASWDHLAWGDGIFDLGHMLAAIEQHGYMGYLSQELITQSYLKDPVSADLRNLCVLRGRNAPRNDRSI